MPGSGPLFGHGRMHDALDAIEDCSVEDLIRITNARRGRAFVVLTEPASAVLNVSARVQMADLTPVLPVLGSRLSWLLPCPMHRPMSKWQT